MGLQITMSTIAAGATVSSYWGGRIDGAFYNSYYGSLSTADAPWAAADAHPNNWDLFETHAGKSVTSVHWGGLPSGITTFDVTANSRTRSRGAFSFYSMAPSHQQVLDLAANSNANGTLTTLANWATAVAAQNYPLLLRPMWEMNGNWGYAWQTNSGITTAQYIAAWRKLYEIVNANATCVSLFWCPNVHVTGGVPDPTPWFPGTAYVDWVGFDGYNKGSSISPSSLFGPTVAIVSGLAPGKPIGIGEVGCEAPTSYAGGKHQWIADFFNYLAATSSIKWFSWFNQAGSPVWPHIEVGDASTTFDGAAETAFKTGIANRRYSGNIVNNTTFPLGSKIPIPGTVTPVPTSSYRPYPSTSAYNKLIPSPAQIHPSSASMISTSSGWLLGGTSSSAYEEWLGPRQRVVYFRGDTSGITRVPIYANWTSAGGYVCATTPIFSAPIPSWFANILAGNAPTGISGDHVAVIVDSITGDAWEFWKLTPPGVASMNISCSSTRWNTIAANYFKADTIIGNGYSETSGSINNGFSSESYCHIYSGVLVPDDFADCFSGSDPGTAVEHMIGLDPHPVSNGTTFPLRVPPARAGHGLVASGIPYGARVQLDPAINVGTWTSVNAKSEPWRSGLKKILRGFQKYGGVVMDDTGGVGAGGFSACHPASVVQGTYNGKTGFKYPWDVAGYGWSYNNGIPYDLMSHFRVIDWTKFTGV